MTETVYVLVLEDDNDFFRETIEGVVASKLKQDLPDYDFVFERKSSRIELLKTNLNTAYDFFIVDINLPNEFTNGVEIITKSASWKASF